MDDLSRERGEFIKADYVQGFIEYCGYNVVSVEKGRLVSALDVRTDHRQQNQLIHAGVMATMADHSAGYAAYTLVPEDYVILTIEFKINFLHPAHGEKLICRSKIIKEGGQIFVGESDVYDVRDKKEVMVAKAMVTLASVHKDRVKT